MCETLNLTLFRGRRRFICRVYAVSEQPSAKKTTQNQISVPARADCGAEQTHCSMLFFVPSERKKTPNVLGLIRHNSSLKPLLYP